MGYRLFNETCVRCGEKNCAVCDESDRCSGCFEDLQSIDFKCSPVKCPLPHCSICVNENICASCDNGHALNEERKCVPAPFNCLEAASATQCNMCQAGFHQTQEHKCVMAPTNLTRYMLIFSVILIVSLLVAILTTFFRRRETEVYHRDAV